MLFHSEFPSELGGKRFYRVSAYEIRDLQRFFWEMHPPETDEKNRPIRIEMKGTLQLPPKSRTLKSPAIPRVLLDAKHFGELEVRDSCPVNDHYLHVLGWFLKRDFYKRHSTDRIVDKELKAVDSKIRAKIIELVFAGEMNFEPSHSSLETLNHLIENFDLGRYTGLNMRHPQDKYLQMRSNHKKETFRERQREEELLKEEAEHARIALSSEMRLRDTEENAEETPFQRHQRLAREGRGTVY